ncbi:arsenic resistance N-acetyltransferase ArsN2 [Salinigranum salinum]|uniref:arsenic resistance N-acetyltransferase ArsN2 n=1 Tax=Salinigranum salinum TaxID=1364937 RepID=UPI001260ECAC|nr:arsenic resistance N-acetyltransferase ArsN2 [Salinigranum salinum]
MPDTSLRLRRATAVDALSDVETLLAEHGLPSADVRSTPDAFYVAFEGSERVGVGGLEPHGTDGLLRSVVVEPSVRGEGYGGDLCAALEARACADGIDTLYLLTTTAADFFGARGYEPIDRADAPPSIRSTTQFADLCPTTATCMRKQL